METENRAIIVFPFSGGCKIPGAELGPIEIARYLDFYRHNKFNFQYVSPKSMKEIQTVIDYQIKNKARTLILGGDHSSTACILNNILDCSIKFGGIIFDAHNDNSNGAEKGYYNWNVLSKIQNSISSGILIGYRDKRSSMPLDKKFIYYDDYFEISDVEYAVKKICAGNEYVYVSIDVDVLNPSEFPGTGYTVAGGIFIRELMHFIDLINKYARKVIFDIVEFNPLIEKEQSLRALDRLICGIMGQ